MGTGAAQEFLVAGAGHADHERESAAADGREIRRTAHHDGRASVDRPEPTYGFVERSGLRLDGDHRLGAEDVAADRVEDRGAARFCAVHRDPQARTADPPSEVDGRVLHRDAAASDTVRELPIQQARNAPCRFGGGRAGGGALRQRDTDAGQPVRDRVGQRGVRDDPNVVVSGQGRVVRKALAVEVVPHFTTEVGGADENALEREGDGVETPGIDHRAGHRSRPGVVCMAVRLPPAGR